jgi:class II flagellar assembly regulator FliX
MRIEQSSSLSSTTARRGAQAASGGSGFAQALSSDTATTAANAPKAVTTVDNLFMLQEIASDLPERRKAAVQRGTSMLDRLDDIRIALLTGSLPRSQLENLRRMAKERGEILNDPQLQSVLDEIELRVAVELAKLDSVA